MDKRVEERTDTADREITLSRDFDAPRDLVWQAWTDPKQVVRWWGPNGFTTTIEKMELRPGGVWKHVMHGPDGTDYPNSSVFQEVVKPERIVFSHGGGKKGGPGAHFVATWTFEALAGDRTRVTIHMVFPTTADRDTVVREYGAIEGGKQTLGRLAAHLASANAAAPADDSAIVITRVFDAPRALVFKAWTRPEHLMRWWAPKGCSTPICKVDLRPGGRFHYCIRLPEGRDIWGIGVYREIVAPSRLVYSDSFADADGNPVPPTYYGLSASHPAESLVTVNFEEHEGKTKLTLRHAIPASVEERKATNQGWIEMLDRLADELAMPERSAPVTTTEGSSATKSTAKEFVISRTFDAPRELMFQLWTDPEHMQRWWGPKGFKVLHSKMDLRPGGIYHYGMRSPDGQDMWGKFVYREIVKPERIVFVNSFSDEQGNVTRHPLHLTWPLEMLSTITFTEQAGRTTVTIRWLPLNATADERKTFEGGFESMQQGWTGTLDQLAGYLGSAAAPGR